MRYLFFLVREKYRVYNETKTKFTKGDTTMNEYCPERTRLVDFYNKEADLLEAKGKIEEATEFREFAKKVSEQDAETVRSWCYGCESSN